MARVGAGGGAGRGVGVAGAGLERDGAPDGHATGAGCATARGAGVAARPGDRGADCRAVVRAGPVARRAVGAPEPRGAHRALPGCGGPGAVRPDAADRAAASVRVRAGDGAGEGTAPRAAAAVRPIARSGPEQGVAGVPAARDRGALPESGVVVQHAADPGGVERSGAGDLTAPG